MKLGFKYWGEKSLYKIVSQLGIRTKRDEATKKRDKIQYARVLIEVKLNQTFPDSVCFLDEHGVNKRLLWFMNGNLANMIIAI